MIMRIASWNINSVRLRIDMVLHYLKEQNIDVLCLQETKTIDDFFPKQKFIDAGYSHIHISGMKSYNGVAIISRHPLTDLKMHHHCDKNDARHITAKLQNDLEIHSIYIPAGGDVPDPKLNDKFAHKLGFLESLTKLFMPEQSQTYQILLGDFNIAPFEHDVWSHRQLRNTVSHTAIEVEYLERFQRTKDWIDTARHFTPADEKLYSWWSYRAKDWEKSNRGRRLDHIWASPNLKPYLEKYETIKEARGWTPKPSDHVPICLELRMPC